MFFLAMCINLDSQFSGTCPRVRYATPVAPRDVSKCGLAEAQRRAHDAPMANVDARKCSRRRHLRVSNSNSQGNSFKYKKRVYTFQKEKNSRCIIFPRKDFCSRTIGPIGLRASRRNPTREPVSFKDAFILHF